jgi:SAM-dependent methyltransferase
MVAILSRQREAILDAVRSMYRDVAQHPEKEFHFPTGRRACEFVGYPAEQLDRLPAGAVESFAGVGYPFAAHVIRPGDTVLDIGSGSGTDALLASLLVGTSGCVIGLDLTHAMREKLRVNARTAGADNVNVMEGSAEEIPLPDASVDIVTTNGVLNLVPRKDRAIREIGRVLRAGGRLQLADIVLHTLPTEACRSRPELWAECVVGATTEADYVSLFREAGLESIEVLSHFDYFRGSNPETRKVAASFGAEAIVLRGVKP